MKMQLVFAFVTVALLSFSLGENPQSYCGRRLAQILAFLCQNENRGEAKKSLPFNSMEYDFFGWPRFGHHKALAMTGIRGKRDGIVSECCENPCTRSELLSYC